MKNLMLTVGFFAFCICFSSCGRQSCGGWYGNRNLDVSTIENKADATNDVAIISEEEFSACR